MAVCDEEVAAEGIGVENVAIVVDVAMVVLLVVVVDRTSCAPPALSSSFS